jgi:thiol-disulfide isomerase/thioredoxin
MNYLRHFAWAAISLLAMASAFTNVPAARADSNVAQDFLQKTYGVKVTIQSEDRITGILHLGPLTDTGQLGDYLMALAVECKKYPAGFFVKAGVSEIVLCGNLDMGEAPIAGLFNQRQKTLYLKYHWNKFGARDRTTFHAFHHELGHALQGGAWGNGHSDWPEWDAVNPPAFQYGGGGGVELMEHPENNWGAWTTNQPGFLNAYSTSAPWEDRSEIMAALMNNGDEAYLRAYYQRDPIIRQKVDLMAHLLSGFCGPAEASYYWERAVAYLRTPPAISLAFNQPQSPLKVDLQDAIGGDLIDNSGNAVASDTLKGKKYFLLYFSASWCSHCRAFMPQFLEFYRNSQYHDDFEVVFVSSDQNESQMMSYLGEMPWKAVRFNSPGQTFLKTNYSRGPGIPTLALIDSDGRFLGLKKGFAKNYDNGVDKMLDILNQKLSQPASNAALEPTATCFSVSAAQ